jgi:uncharacterized delta-60 repeat protein/uncharacterized repeat protein (TIGR01451 family)
MINGNCSMKPQPGHETGRAAGFAETFGTMSNRIYCRKMGLCRAAAASAMQAGARRLLLVAAVAWLGAGSVVEAQQVINGQPGVATRRATMRFTALAAMGEQEGWTNVLSARQKRQHRPMPLGTNDSGDGFHAAAAGGEATFAAAAVGGATTSPPPAVSFQAVLDNNTVIPPDTHGAVGPNHVMTVLNSQVRIQDRTGTILSTVALDLFWLPVGFVSAFDPKVLYDHVENRWIFVSMADGFLPSSSIMLAVSQTSDPTGNWNFYTVDADTNDMLWADYPSLGFNKDWIVVTANMFGINTPTNGPVNVYAFNKTNLYAGGVGQFTLLQETSGTAFTMVPAITYDSNLAVEYLVEADNLIAQYVFGSINRLRISTITGPVGAEQLTVATAFAASGQPWGTADLFGTFLPQLGSIGGIDAGDARIQNVVYRNGSLWCTHTAFLPAASPTHTAAQWWQINTNGQVRQLGRVEDPVGIVSYAYPSIAVNQFDDVLLGFSRFSPSQYASANYAFRGSGDPTNTMQADYVLKAGEAPYFKTFGGFANRWGDFSSTVVDPLNDTDMWTIQEYASTPFGAFSRWGTWWGMVSASAGVRFNSSVYTINEAPPPGFINITVINAGGAAGSVDFATSDGTAVAGTDYLPASGTINFSAGQLTASFTVQVLDNPVVNSNKTVNLSLSNPQGAVTLGYLTNAVLIIIDDESRAVVSTAGEFNFSSWIDSAGFGQPYVTTMNESDFNPFCYPLYFIDRGRSALGVLVTVVRTNGSSGRVMVDYRTVDNSGTAIPNIDYFPVSGTLVFDDYQMSTNFVVPLRNLTNGFFITTNIFDFFKFVNIELSNPRPAPEEEAARPGLIRPTLGPGSTSGLLMYDVGLGAIGITGNTIAFVNAFAFERLHYRFDEHPGRDPRIPGGSNVVEISVVTATPVTASVIVRTYHHVRGAGLGGINNFPFGILPGNSTLTLGGYPTIDAGSDFASSPLGGSEVLANPVFTDPTLSPITNVADYVVRDVTLNFGNSCREEANIIIQNDSAVEFNEDIIVRLIRVPGSLPINPYASICNVTVLYKDQPAGAVDRDWNPDNVESTPDRSYNQTPGANNTVNAVAVQSDSKTVLGGDFTAVNTKSRNRIARLNADGSVDTSFNPGVGADSSVSSVLLYPPGNPLEGRIVIGGSFSSYNGTPRNSVARLLTNGTLDATFVVGNGANGTVRAMAMQPDGKIIIVGDFTEYNDFSRNRLARLNADGSLDFSFDAGPGADTLIWSVAVAPDGAGGSKVLIGGDFLFYNGEFRAGIARLNANGSLDTGFDPGGGANNSVYAIAVQVDGMVVMAGAFNEVDARRRVGIARLHPNGSLDTSFDPGTGPDKPIYALTLQPDQKAIVGGPFTSYNGTRRMGFTRLRFDGTVDTTFLDTAYNQFAGLINATSFEPPNAVNSIAVQPDGNVMIGGSFKNIGGNPSFLADVRNHYTQFTRSDKRVRYNVARVLGGSTPGPGNTEFEVDDYTVDENGDVASLKLQRVDGRLGTVVANAGTADRTATVNADFVNTNLITLWPEAFYQTNANLTFPILFPTNFAPLSVGRVDPVYLRVPILDDTLREGDESIDLSFIRPEGSITLGGEFIPLGAALGRSSARLTILDNDFDAGTLVFSSPTFVTNENALRATITVIRTNGANGAAGVDYFTTTETPAPRATPGTGPEGDYSPASGRLTFASGQTVATFNVTLVNDTRVEFDENIGLVLTNASGARLPGGTPTSVATATLTIVDNDFPPGRLNLALPAFSSNESDGAATIAVSRIGGSSGAVSVDYQTLSGSAISPADFASTGGTLSWNDGESVPKTFTVPLVIDGLPEGTETFSVRLFNGRVGGVLSTNLLGLRTNSTVAILDADAYGTVAFSQPYYQADKNSGAAIITVIRGGGIAGTGTVNFATIPNTATPGTDYFDTNGVLTFLPGEIGKTFTVGLLDDMSGLGNKIVDLVLSAPANVTLGSPSIVPLTLIDNRSFNEPAGALDTLFGDQTQANGPVFALALQMTNGITDGRIVVAGDFTDFNQVVRNRLARLMTNGALDTSFDPGPGANDAIRAIAAQSDGRLVIGGFFTQVISTNRNRIARLNVDGSLDGSFNPGAGADNPVYAITLQPDGRILVGGAFSAFNSTNVPGIARLNTNGTVDLNFKPGSGANGPVYAIALQSDGRVVIGGDFSVFNGVPRHRIARLNVNGSLDTAFDPGGGMNGPVRALLFQPDGKIVAGGSFTTVNGVTRSYLARLNSDGSLDTGFLGSSLAGADNSVFALALQVDGRIVVAGDFNRFNDVSRNRISRLNNDGSSDPAINFGSGADAFISSLLIQPDRKIVLGGGFTTYDGETRLRIARIHGGSMAGAGSLTFTRAEFLAGENTTNATIVVRRRGGTAGTVGVNYQTTDGTAVAGVDYQAVSGTLTFPQAETFQTFTVPILNNFTPDGDRILNLQLIGGSYTGGAVAGPQPTSTLRILDDEGIVGFTTASFSVNEGVASQLAAITVIRSGATNAPVTVSFATVAGGSATPGLDYVATNGTLTFLPGELTKSFQVRILDDANGEGSETVLLALSNASNSNTLGIANATLTIVDNEFSPGQFVFGATAYSVAENATNAVLTVIRTNGSSGFASVSYRTVDGTATGGLDYLSTNHNLTFGDGETVKIIAVPLIDDLLVESPEVFNVVLFNVTGGAGLGTTTNVPVTIVDNDVSLIIPAGSSLLSESLTNNGIIDAGETVTMSFALRNVGSGNTSNLVATLLPGNGVASPSGPQSYGVLLAGGASVSRTFSFTASGNIGDRLLATLQLIDGPATNGFATFAFTIGGQASRTFANSGAITINDDAPASPYPSTIDVANMGGTITKVSVTLSNFSHAWPNDVDILLVGPNGQRVTLMSDAGTNIAVSNLQLTFSDTATIPVPLASALQSRTYLPANYAAPGLNTADRFLPPAPQIDPVNDPFPYTNTALSVFNGTSPNGTWSLFVMDDTASQNGSIAGWSLLIQTSDPVAPSAGVSVADLAVSASGVPAAAVVGTTYSSTLTVTNRGPAPAVSVALLDQMPAGLALVSANASVGTWNKVQGTLTWIIGSLPSGGSASLTMVLRPTILGTLASAATASANQVDPHPVDNTATMVTTGINVPDLTVLRVGSSLRLSWPANTGFKLQSTESVNPANWVDVGATAQVENGQNIVTVGVPGNARFYRLRSP